MHCQRKLAAYGRACPLNAARVKNTWVNWTILALQWCIALPHGQTSSTYKRTSTYAAHLAGSALSGHCEPCSCRRSGMSVRRMSSSSGRMKCLAIMPGSMRSSTALRCRASSSLISRCSNNRPDLHNYYARNMLRTTSAHRQGVRNNIESLGLQPQTPLHCFQCVTYFFQPQLAAYTAAARAMLLVFTRSKDSQFLSTQLRRCTQDLNHNASALLPVSARLVARPFSKCLHCFLSSKGCNTGNCTCLDR